LLRAAYDDWGLAGLRLVAHDFDTDPHHQVLGQLRDAAQDPAFTARLEPIAAAKVKALARDPAHFVPCREIAHGYSA
jgi:hypothetical protein